MRSALPTPQRITPKPEAQSVWLAPVNVDDQRLYPLVLAHHRDAWDFLPATPAIGEKSAKWPEVGELVPRVHEIRMIPGVDGTPDPRPGPFPATQVDRVSKARNAGDVIIENGDPRLGPDEEHQYWLCETPVAGGLRLLHPAWEVAERVGNKLVWRVDRSVFLPWIRRVATFVPALTESKYQEMRADLRMASERQARRASRSEIATREYERSVEILAQLDRTWQAYAKIHPPQRIRVASARVRA